MLNKTLSLFLAGLAVLAGLAAGGLALVQPVAAQQTAPPQVEVITAALNVREGPGVDFAVVAVALQGDTFEVTGANADQSWLQIKRPDGSLAWLSGWKDYTQVTGSLANVTVAQPAAAPAAAGSVPAPTGSGKLALMTGSGGDIYLINADGSNLRLLVSGGLDPAISPDGSTVAFTRWGVTEGVYLIKADGTNERQVHPAHWPKSPSWSPDGSQLVFNMQRGGRLSEVRECKTSSSKNATLPPDAYDVDRREIEKDEKYEYCYSLPVNPWWQLRKVNLASGEYQDLNSDTGSFAPAWDPRESWRVVYSGDANLVQLDLNRDEKFTLQEGRADRMAAFSPDGTRLAVAHKLPNGQYQLHVINMDTAERTALAVQGSNISPTWSPDGSQIAFLSDRDGAWNIYVMNADGSNQRPMFAAGALAGIGFRFDQVDERMLSWGK